MPADAWVVPFAVGECSPYRAERGSGTQDPTKRGQMAGHTVGRIDDTMLIREAQRGNRAAFEELVRHYDQAVLRLAMHLTGSEHDAQDIYQDAFLKAYKNVGSFRFECSFYTLMNSATPDAGSPTIPVSGTTLSSGWRALPYPEKNGRIWIGSSSG